MRYLALLCLVSILFFNCNSDDDDDVSVEETVLIQQYLSDNNLTADSTASGLRYIIETAGEGDNPTLNSTVTVNYKGFFLNGAIFDESTDGPATFPLRGVIAGWQEGIPLFKRGGKGLLVIPSYLAYGEQGQGPIPPNTPIAFEVELIDFE